MVQCIRSLDRGARVEQKPDAGLISRFDGMVQRLAVIRTRAGVEQHARQVRIVILSGGAIERAQGMVEFGIFPRLVWISSGVQQQARATQKALAELRKPQKRRVSDG